MKVKQYCAKQFNWKKIFQERQAEKGSCVTIVNSFYLLAIVAKLSILNVFGSPSYVSTRLILLCFQRDFEHL